MEGKHEKGKKSIISKVLTKKKVKQTPKYSTKVQQISSQLQGSSSQIFSPVGSSHHKQAISTQTNQTYEPIAFIHYINDTEKQKGRSPTPLADKFRYLPLYNALGQKWLELNAFDKFFKTLRPKQDLPDPMYILDRRSGYSQIDLWDDSRPSSRKKKQDKDWSDNKKESSNLKPTRRSGRIEKIQQKGQIETRRAQLSYAYYQGQYRYSIKQVGFTLSYLQANCMDSELYEQTIENIPPEPEYKQLGKQKVNSILEQKAKNLRSRVIERF